MVEVLAIDRRTSRCTGPGLALLAPAGERQRCHYHGETRASVMASTGFFLLLRVIRQRVLRALTVGVPPRRHREVIRDAWRSALGMIALTGGLALAITWVVYRQGPVVPGAIATAVFLVVILIAFLNLLDYYRNVRIIPYFERPVGGIDTFLGGEALVRQIQPLDDLAAEIGVTPLSDFGFADDLDGEAMTWHAAEHGLRSVQALLDALESQPDRVGQAQATISDLRKIADALGKARDGEIRFALLIRHGNGTSLSEWERRKGSAS